MLSSELQLKEADDLPSLPFREYAPFAAPLRSGLRFQRGRHYALALRGLRITFPRAFQAFSPIAIRMLLGVRQYRPAAGLAGTHYRMVLLSGQVASFTGAALRTMQEELFLRASGTAGRKRSGNP